MAINLFKKISCTFFLVSFRYLLLVSLVIISSIMCFANKPVESKKSPTILFLNPGEPVDRGKGLFWPLTANLMNVSAKNFGMELEVLYAERDHLLMLRQAEVVSKRKILPDYIIMVNEKQTAPAMLKMFEGTKTKIMLLHNDLTSEQRSEIGNERENMSNWIGTVTTDEERGTYRMMEELYRQLGEKEPKVIGITGARGTPVSLERAQGVEDFMEQSKRGQRLQLTFSNWSTSDAESKAKILLSRYPQTNIIWAANFSMVLGALNAVKASNANVLVGSTAAPPLSMANLAEEDISVSLGSHFFIGAWSMVLLYDYHNGLDFISNGGVRQRIDYLTPINSDNASLYYKMVYEDIDTLDFSIFSKYLNSTLKNYNFSLDPLMSKE